MRPYVESRSICQGHVRARACLTPMHVGWGCHRLRRKFSGNPTRLMPPTSSPAPPAGTAPPSRVLLRHPRRRLGYPRAHVGRPIFIECLLSNPTVQVFQRFQGARVRHEKKRWPLRGRKEIGNAAVAAQNSNPGFTEPTLPRNVRGKYRHCSARALAGLASFADRSTPLPRSANSSGALSLRSDGRKQPRPASDRAHPRKHQQDVARLRPT